MTARGNCGCLPAVSQPTAKQFIYQNSCGLRPLGFKFFFSLATSACLTLPCFHFISENNYFYINCSHQQQRQIAWGCPETCLIFSEAWHGLPGTTSLRWLWALQDTSARQHWSQARGKPVNRIAPPITVRRSTRSLGPDTLSPQVSVGSINIYRNFWNLNSWLEIKHYKIQKCSPSRVV